MARDLLLGYSPRTWSRGALPAGAKRVGIMTSTGSVLLPASQQKAIFAKVDDVRFDLRQAGRNVGATVLVLSAALGALAAASVYRTSKGK